MKKNFKYSILNKIVFYFSYFFYKLIIPFEIKKPKLKMWWYEFVYSLNKFIDYNRCIPWNYPINVITTKFGTFKIRKGTADASNISTAFERRDQNYLLHLISRLIREEKKVLFLDIGGDLGSYSILVANKFNNSNVKIKCFEPINESYELIKENIKLNTNTNSIKVYPVALSNANNDNIVMQLNTLVPGSSSMKTDNSSGCKTVKINTRKLDSVILNDISDFDVIVMKIDVEGMEKDVLLGAQNLLDTQKEIYLMVEDFIFPEIIKFLEGNNWSFLTKVTSYNSWWAYNNK